MLAGAPATFLVHKVTLKVSMKVSARTVDQKSKENLVPMAIELSWLPWAASSNLFYVEKKGHLLLKPLFFWIFCCVQTILILTGTGRRHCVRLQLCAFTYDSFSLGCISFLPCC